MDTPKISVIMPVYNSEKYIKKAIDSILDQSYTNFELLVINDRPTDSTMDIVKTYSDHRIHIINNIRNMGISFSRNAGIEYSSGKYIAIMDHDDISLPDRFEKQVHFLDGNENIDVLGGRFEIIDENENVIVTSAALNNPKYIRALLLLMNVYCNSEVMFRKSLIENNKIRYQDNYLGLEDFRFWIDCSKVGNLSNIDDIVLKHRKILSNETSRILREKYDERKKLYTELQAYSLLKSGFRLNDNQLGVLFKFLDEEKTKCGSMKELVEFYKALQEIVDQARKMQLDNCKEIEIMCKKQLTSKFNEIADMWS